MLENFCTPLVKISSYPGKFHKNVVKISSYPGKFIIPYFLDISDEKGQIDYPSLSQNFEMKPQLKIVLIYQVLTKQYMKKKSHI